MQVKGEFPLTKGPLALFYGGKDIAPLLSSNSTTASNMPLTILCLSSPLLQIFLQLYKKFRFRKEIGYEHQLKQAVMTGFQNVYGSISIFLAFLIFLLLIIGHQYISYHYNIQENAILYNASKLKRQICGQYIFVLFACCFPFTKNAKLRSFLKKRIERILENIGSKSIAERKVIGINGKAFPTEVPQSTPK